MKEINDRQNNIILLFSFLIFPFFSLPIVFRMAKKGSLFALILWSLFLSVFGFLMFPSHDVIQHWFYYDLFSYSNIDTYLVAWKHDFLLTFFQYYFAKFHVEFQYIVFLFIFFGSCCNLYVYQRLISEKKYINNSIIFIIFFGIFPLFSIISGLRNGLAIEFVFIGAYLLLLEKKILYSFLFFLLGCCTHFSVLFSVILIVVIYFVPKSFKIQKKNVLPIIIISSLIILLSMDLIFHYIGESTNFVDKVESYSNSGDMDYIEQKSFKWQVLYQLRKCIFIIYVFLFVRAYKSTKLDVLVIILISVVIGTINYTIINNRFLALTICFIGLSIVVNASYNSSYFILKKFATTLMISLFMFLVQSYSKFLMAPKLGELFYLPYPVLISKPYTNEEYRRIYNQTN